MVCISVYCCSSRNATFDLATRCEDSTPESKVCMYLYRQAQNQQKPSVSAFGIVLLSQFDVSRGSLYRIEGSLLQHTYLA